MAIDGVGVLAMDSGAGGMSDEAGRLVFSRDPSGTFIDGMVFGTSGGGENANLEVLCALSYELVRPHASASVLIVSDDCWDALIAAFDVPDEQALDCLCLAIRCGGAWPVDGGGGGAMV